MVNKDYEHPRDEEMIEKMTNQCAFCQTNIVQTRPPLPPLVRVTQIQGTRPGKDWKAEFTIMPVGPGESKYLLMFADTFTVWIEVFPCRTERINNVTKTLKKDIIPQFRLPKSIQNDNRPIFIPKIISEVANALNIKLRLQPARGLSLLGRHNVLTEPWERPWQSCARKHWQIG